jgi:tetratricopeptide (TPR) repeat protein
MEQQDAPAVTPLRRALAYWWYIWAQSCCYWGIRTMERSFFRTGVSFYGAALRTWPGFATAYYWRGVIRSRELSEHLQGIADLTHAIELEPEWPDAYLQRGLIQRFHGDQQAAMADLQAFLSLGGELYWRLEAERQIAHIRSEQDSDG